MSRPIHPAGTSVPSTARRSASASKRVGDHQVGREEQLARGALGLRQHRAGELDALLLHERVAGLDPLGTEEAEAHGATDQDLVGDLQEALEHPDLVGDLGPAEDDAERALGVVAHRRQLAHLPFEEQPCVAGEVVRHALGRGVSAVSRPEGVVHVDLGQGGQAGGQLWVVGGLPRLEAAVLQQHDVPGRIALDQPPHLRPRDARSEVNVHLEQGCQPRRQQGHGQLRLAVLRAPEMRDQDRHRAAFAQQLDRRQRRPDPGVVGHEAVVQGDVEVDAYEDAPALDVGVADARLAERPPGRPGLGGQAPTAAGSSTLAASSTQRFE